MEFVHYDGEKLNKILVDYERSVVIFDSIKSLNIKKVLYKTEHEGKIIIDNYIVRYIKANLYLYDDNHNLLGEYKLSKKISQEDFSLMSGNLQSNNLQSNNLLINKYALKKNHFISLYKNKVKGYFIEFNGLVEDIIENYNIGFDTVYKTNKGNTLQTSMIKNNKWNGCPIGRII